MKNAPSIRIYSKRSTVAKLTHTFFVCLCLTALPIFLAFYFLHLWSWDFSVPLVYGIPGADEIWQLVATKTVLDTGWVLTNPFLGAPDVSTWYGNSGSQTSALHSIFMLAIGVFVEDAVRVQQFYFIICCSLISISSYVACQLTGSRRLPSIAVGVILCFTTYRLHSMSFAYLANYIMVPLAIVPPFWIMQGRFSVDGALTVIKSKKFFIAVCIIVLTSMSDGYYAFFTLLLTAFSIFLRIISGDVRRPSRLLAPFIIAACAFATVMALSYPIREYRATHPTEADQDQMKAPTDAEVYSPSLKLLIAPTVDHRIAAVADLGKYIVETANFNRKFPYTQGATIVLGTFGTLIFLSILLYWITRGFQTNPGVISKSLDGDNSGLPIIMAILSMFILLCTIGGGVGSLIALIFPSIRAYDRFPIFLISIIYITAAYCSSRALEMLHGSRAIMVRIGLVVSAWLVILDQVPKDMLGLSNREGFQSRSVRFLSERDLVHKIEGLLPSGSMVYQFPYSQYLTNNKYYGWGAFGQLRLYLHSKSLRWSNGGAKGAPSENWHERMSVLPTEDLLDEMQAVGFRAVVADRLVLPDGEYQAFKELMKRRTNADPIENEDAKLAYWTLPAVPFNLEYEADYETVSRFTVEHAFDPEAYGLPRLLNAAAFMEFMAAYRGSYPLVLTRTDHPTLFFSGAEMDRGFGQDRITPISDMKGDLDCGAFGQAETSLPQDTVVLSIRNRTSFDWKFGSGNFPLYVGLHYFDAEGQQQKQEMNLPYSGYVEAGDTVKVEVPLQTILSPDLRASLHQVTVRLALVQSGHAWFSQPGNNECSVVVKR